MTTLTFTDSTRNKLGNLRLTDQEEDDLVAFLKKLIDGYKVPGAAPTR